MKLTFFIFTIILLVFFGFVSFSKSKNKPTDQIEKINKLTFMENYTNSTNGLLIDIRTPEEFNSGHIKGALNINFYDADFIEQIKKVAAGKDLFIYCRSGARSGNAKEQLQKEGFTVEDLTGGISSHPELITQ